MTYDEFIAVMHVKPRVGDLERANCPHAGDAMHMQCGVCSQHGLPMIYCLPCTGARILSMAKTGYQPQPFPARTDVEIATSFLTMQRRWLWTDYVALRELVARTNSHGPLGRDGYLLMRRLKNRVSEMLFAEFEAARHFGLPTDLIWNEAEADDEER